MKLGLGVYAALSVLDIVGLVATDGKHPPYSVAIAGAILGLVSIALVAMAWRGNRRAVAPLVVLRILSALTAVPAFVVDDVPVAAQVLAGVIIAMTVLATLMVATAPRAAVAA